MPGARPDPNWRSAGHTRNYGKQFSGSIHYNIAVFSAVLPSTLTWNSFGDGLGKAVTSNYFVFQVSGLIRLVAAPAWKEHSGFGIAYNMYSHFVCSAAADRFLLSRAAVRSTTATSSYPGQAIRIELHALGNSTLLLQQVW
jgi:hypothetical protein